MTDTTVPTTPVVWAPANLTVVQWGSNPGVFVLASEDLSKIIISEDGTKEIEV